MKNVVRNAWIAALPAALLLAACASEQRHDSSMLVMGTQATVSLWVTDPERAARLSQKVEQQWQKQSIDWYAWTPDSGELKRLNAALAQGRSFRPSDTLRRLLQTAQQWHVASDGYFDPAVAPLTAAWGFADLATTTTPDAQQLTAWRTQRPRLSDLHIGNTVSSARRDLQLDLGAIAKGHALDLAAQTLRNSSSAARLNLGGQVLVQGALPAAARVVSIRAPKANTLHELASVLLRDGESIATSGDYERTRQSGKVRIHHLLDPYTGMPVAHTRAVTVIAPNATLADAASTALMAAGPAHWRRIAQQLHITEVLRVDGAGKIEVTAALYARLRWSAPLTRDMAQAIQIINL